MIISKINIYLRLIQIFEIAIKIEMIEEIMTSSIFIILMKTFNMPFEKVKRIELQIKIFQNIRITNS